jgi:hypothetical protein
MISSGLITSLFNGALVLIEIITYSDGKQVKRIIDPHSLVPMHIVHLN